MRRDWERMVTSCCYHKRTRGTFWCRCRIARFGMPFVAADTDGLGVGGYDGCPWHILPVRTSESDHSIRGSMGYLLENVPRFT